MTRQLATALLLAALTGLSSVAVRAEDEPATPPPYESVRTLRRLQESIAHGSTAAQTALPTLLATIGSRFLDADPAAWRDPRNARAAVLFLFSGGRPAVVRTVLSRSTIPREADRLLKGALAYAEGQDQVARDLLAPIDARSQPSIVGGQLALVEGTLLAATDKPKAMHFFDLARLLAPGSLVEEAALRRQIAMEAGAADPARFVTLSRQYFHRFSGSVYAQTVRQLFAATAVRLAGAGDLAVLARLDPAIAEFSPGDQRALYLAMARGATVRGRAEAARLAAGHVAGAEAPVDAARARLYLDAASIVSEDAGRGVAALEAIDAAKLPAPDADLRAAALAVAHAVRTPVPDGAGAAPGAGSEPDTGAVMDDARRALAQGDAILKARP